MAHMFPRVLTAIVIATALACDEPEPSAPAPPTEPEPASSAPRIEIHEWGLLDGPSLHAGHLTRVEPPAIRAPVIYAHLPEGVELARFDLTVRLAEGHRIMEHYPGGGALMPGEPLVWAGVEARADACGTRRYPRHGSAGCRTEDHVCEAQHGRRWETPDGACLHYGDQPWDHLFYRAQLGEVELPVRHTLEADVVRVESDDTLVGMVYRTRDGAVSWVDPPSTGASVELRLDAESDVDAATARIRADLGFHGLTSDEADAFLREWDDLFGGHSLLYWLPAAVLDRIARLEGDNLDFERAVLVRVPLE